MSRIKDLTGQHINRWTVIKRDPSRIDRVYWLCQCECGNTCKASTNTLRNGDKKSCGCSTRIDKKNSSQAKLDLVGQRFGTLTVVNKDFETAKWRCKCDCGNENIYIRSDQLLSKTQPVKSCCLYGESKGELKIKEILEKNNIPFIQQKTFDDCINPKTNKKLKFDFFINNSYLLEYDGIQHYENVEYFKDSLEEIQYRDQIKNDYCQRKNIPLIRISYSKYNTLSLDDIILKEQIKNE